MKKKSYLLAVIEGTLEFCGVSVKFEVTYTIRREGTSLYIERVISSGENLLYFILSSPYSALGLPECKHGVGDLERLYNLLQSEFKFPEKIPDEITTKCYKIKYKPIKIVPAEKILAKILEDYILEKL